MVAHMSKSNYGVRRMPAGDAVCAEVFIWMSDAAGIWPHNNPLRNSDHL